MAVETERKIAPNLNPTPHQRAQRQNTRITQPRIPSGGDQLLNAADQALVGSENIAFPSSPYALNDMVENVTGPPPVQPFSQQNSRPLPGTSTPDPKPVTREPLPRQASGGLAPPVTDHDYAAPGPPPGFENYQSGGPRRNINPPARFSDYDTS